MFGHMCVGAEPESRETLIKAAYLLKFPLYVTWPKNTFKDDDSPLVIGVLENSSIGRVLERRVPRTTAKGRKIVVLRFRSMDDYKPCHMLFVPRSAHSKIHTMAIAKTKNSPVLIVGERGGFGTAGGVVNFYIDVNNTVGFEINRDAAIERKLKVDARLLKLARIVRTQPPPRPPPKG